MINCLVCLTNHLGVNILQGDVLSLDAELFIWVTNPVIVGNLLLFIYFLPLDGDKYGISTPVIVVKLMIFHHE